MAYAAATDLSSKWGVEAVNLLAWDDTLNAPNTARIATALSNASAIVDGYLARRYALPVNPQPDAASLLNALACDLAMGQLAINPGQRTDIIVDSEKRALSFLRDLADGKAALALIPPPGAEQPDISPGEAVLIDHSPDFARRRWRDL
ncbi:phage protein Gp36 family protein [Rhodoblastus sp.]|uniref:phage protein Gp36 family protein n=1 Tax=Rhodoblastus sp. TaxID=1962975 RepID=UPI003F996ED0